MKMYSASNKIDLYSKKLLLVINIKNKKERDENSFYYSIKKNNI